MKQDMHRIYLSTVSVLFEFYLLTSSASCCAQLKEVRSKVSNVRSHPGRLRSQGGHKVEGIGDVIKHGRGVRELDQAGHSKRFQKNLQRTSSKLYVFNTFNKPTLDLILGCADQ